MILFPNAKINIGLDVVNRRSDGYHDLVTLFYPVPWRDMLEIVPASGGETTLTVTGRCVDCPPEKNLVMKAYRALDAVVPLPPVDIYLHKIIPDGAGLGGGSADAAFTLVGLNRMFDLGLSSTRLAGIASKLGADCAFFVYDRPMLARGIGDVLTDCDLDLSGYSIAIVKPQVGVSTAEAYNGVVPAVPPVDLGQLIAGGVESWAGKVKNDFERSIFKAHPVIAGIKEQLYEMGAVYASMSGSGASVYGIFAKECDTLSAKVKDLFCDCDTFVSPLAL